MAGFWGPLGGVSVLAPAVEEVAKDRCLSYCKCCRNHNLKSILAWARAAAQISWFSNRSWSAANPLGGQSPRSSARQNHLIFRPNQHPQRSRCPGESSRSPAGNPSGAPRYGHRSTVSGKPQQTCRTRSGLGLPGKRRHSAFSLLQTRPGRLSPVVATWSSFHSPRPP